MYIKNTSNINSKVCNIYRETDLVENDERELPCKKTITILLNVFNDIANKYVEY